MSEEAVRPDIQAAMDRMVSKFGARRELKKLTEHLWHDEQVQQMTSGSYGGGLGLVILTDRRLMFIKEGIMNRTNEDFPLDKLSSAQWSSGLGLGKITVFASGNKAEITQMNKTEGKRMVDLLRARLSAPPSPTSAPVPAPEGGGVDPVDQIRRLAELRDAGILSNEEFEAKKTDILGRM